MTQLFLFATVALLDCLLYCWAVYYWARPVFAQTLVPIYGCRPTHSSTPAPSSALRSDPSWACLNNLGVPEQSVGAELRVWANVRLADLVQPAAGLAAGPRSATFNRISRKHVDFVLCDPRTLAVVAVVELDDRSHQRADRRERDALVDGVLAVAGIAILHVPCRQGYNVAELRERILSTLSAGRSDAGDGNPLRLAS